MPRWHADRKQGPGEDRRVLELGRGCLVRGGKSDPKLTLLELKLDDGEIWASTDSSLKFGWEIAKANMSDEKMPDVGVHREVRFA